MWALEPPLCVYTDIPPCVFLAPRQICRHNVLNEVELNLTCHIILPAFLGNKKGQKWPKLKSFDARHDFEYI